MKANRWGHLAKFSTLTTNKHLPGQLIKRDVALHDLAHRIAATLPRPCAVVAGGALAVGAERYVPDISLAQSEIGLKVAIGLDAAVARSVAAGLAAEAATRRQGTAQEIAACTR